jgi:hypothetical protein
MRDAIWTLTLSLAAWGLCASSLAHPPSSPPEPGPHDSGFPNACPDGSAPSQVTPIPVGDGRTLFELACTFYAYQGDVAYWLQREGERPRPLLTVLGNPRFKDGVLTNLEKARGLGDCGSFQVFRLTDTGFTLMEHRTRACDESGAPPPAETWPLVGGEAVSAPPNSSTHCTDKSWFSCPVKGGKVLSLCGDGAGSWLQYVYGPVGAPELVWPETPNGLEGFAVSEHAFLRSMLTSVRFDREAHTYLIVDQIGSGIDGEAHNFNGVVVRKGDTEIARVACTRQPADGLSHPAGLETLGYVD